MEKRILTVLVIGLSIFLSSAALAEGEKELININQNNIKACQQKVILLEKKIENLRASSQNKNVVIFAGEEKEDSIDPSSLLWWERWGEEEPDS